MMWAWLLLACSSADPQTGEVCAEGPTWESAGQPFVTTWCTPCHSRTVVGDDRMGAPEGVDFDTLTGVQLWADQLRPQVEGDDAPMPPAGGPTAEDRAAFVAWLDCGLPGQAETPALTCDQPRPVAGPVVADATLCADGEVAIDGDLQIDSDVDVSCVCTVAGHLEVAAVEVVAPRLTEVGGTLRVPHPTTERVALPELAHAGAVEITAPNLVSLYVPVLAQVSGSVHVDGAGLSRVDVSGLVHVGGDLRIADAPQVDVVRVDRLEQVDGDLTLERLEALLRWRTTHGLDTVGGSLRLRDLPQLEALDGLTALTSVGGDLRFERTGATVFTGLDRLATLGGSFVLDDHAALVSVRGAPDLEAVGGDWVVRDVPQLATLDAPVFLQRVAGDLVVQDNAALTALPAFVGFKSVGGDVTVVGNPVLSSQEVRDTVAGWTVAGTVTVSDNGP